MYGKSCPTLDEKVDRQIPGTNTKPSFSETVLIMLYVLCSTSKVNILYIYIIKQLTICLTLLLILIIISFSFSFRKGRKTRIQQICSGILYAKCYLLYPAEPIDTLCNNSVCRFFLAIYIGSLVLTSSSLLN